MTGALTEEIATRLRKYPTPMAATVDSIDLDPPCVHVDLLYPPGSRLPISPRPYVEFLNHAPADHAHLLARIQEQEATIAAARAEVATLTSRLALSETVADAARKWVRDERPSSLAKLTDAVAALG